jgi:hypothetical protein
MTLVASLFVAGAAVTGLHGGIHLLDTFCGSKPHPRDDATFQAMQTSHPVITRQTAVCRATKGFSASHSLGAILFALVFGYLAGWHLDFLQQSVFLLSLGMACLLAYLVLAWKYWFGVPMHGIALASGLFDAGLAGTWVELPL